MTRTEEALLAAVVAAPADDLPRLAMADWLEEHGDDARAEFIRCQLELARLGDPDPPACGGYYCEVGFDGQVFHRDCRGERLRRRGDYILGEDTSTAPGSICPRYHLWCRDAGFDPAWVPVAGFGLGADLRAESSFRRGFIGAATLPTVAWLRHGPALVRAAPLGRVTLSDRRPQHGLTGAGERYWAWGWHGGGWADPHPGCLPDHLWAHAGPGVVARRYPSEASALDDASRMALAWARAAAVAAPPAAGV